MKKNVKILIIVLIILGVAAAGIYSMATPVIAPLTPVAAKNAELAFSEQGTVTAGRIVSIYPSAQGALLHVNVREGQSIRAGDVLCVIDDRTLLLRKAELEGVINGYEAQMQSAVAQDRSNNAVAADKWELQNTLIEQNQRDLDRALTDLEKMEILFEEGGISLMEVDAARALVEKTRSALTGSRHELAVLAEGLDVPGMANYYKAMIDSNQATLAILEQEIEDCLVKAPVDGVVMRLPVLASNRVSSAAPVAEIRVSEETLIETYVSTQDINHIYPDDEVGLVLKRRDGDIHFTGRITQVDSTAEPILSTLGVEEYKVRVWIAPDLSKLDGTLPGMGFRVDVRFILYKEEEKIAVPKTALYRDGGKDMLWVVRDGKAKAVEVSLGRELRTETVVESGLAEGDFVVTDANNTALKDGVNIRDES